MGAKKLDKESIISRLPKYISIDFSTYNFTHNLCRFIDIKYGEFWARPKDVFKGSGHRLRGNEKLSNSLKMSIDEVKKRLPNFVKIVDSTYKCFYKKCDFIINDKIIHSSPKQICKRTWKKITTKLTEKQCKKKLPKHIKIDYTTYKGGSEKCRFIDKKYGEFWAPAAGVLSGKSNHKKRTIEIRKKNNLAKWGVEYTSQLPEIMNKIRKSSRNTVIKYHWKTNEEILCVGGYESKVVDYFNFHEIDFLWQIPFKLKNSTYYCDAYLKNEDVYIEIKGWFMQEISRLKWEEFHNKYKNSELWNKEKLVSLGIIK